MHKPDGLLFEKRNEDVEFTVVEKSKTPWLQEDIMLEVSVDNGCCETQVGCLTKDEVIELQDFLKEYLKFLDNRTPDIDSLHKVPKKYVKKPVVVTALQIHGNPTEIKEFVGDQCDAYIEDSAWEVGKGIPSTHVTIHTLEGDMFATDGDYIIKGGHGEFYPCKQDIFKEIYEEVPTEGGSDV